MLSSIDNILLNNAVKNVSVEIAANIGQTQLIMEKWLKVFCDKLHDIYVDMGHTVVAFVLDFSCDGSFELNSVSLQTLSRNGIEACSINENHFLGISDDLNSADQIDIGNSGSEKGLIIFRFNGEVAEIYIKGLLKYRINVMHPGSKEEIRISAHSRRCKDYILAIEDHGKKGLIFKMDKFWADRQRRILMPGKTEEFFQMELFDWLGRNLSDGFPKIETKTNAGDRTDIDIYSYQTGQHYIIEVKWLGESKSGTKYGYDRIIEGIGQIRTYLERDESLNEACLVCYDGRGEVEHKNNSSFDMSLLPLKGKHKIIFLESKSASRKGEDYAANQS